MYYFLKGIALKQLFLLFVEDELHSGVDGKGGKKKHKCEGGGKGNTDINLKREAFGHQK